MNYINKNRAILYAWLNDSDGDHDAARAEADMTYTESGWLLSYEWTFTELHAPADLLTYVNRK